MSGPALLKHAADALLGLAARDPQVTQLLEALDYDGLFSGAPAPDRANKLKLLNFAGRLDAFFPLDAPQAPGLACFGGLVGGASVTGRGMTLKAAFEGCVGEAVEYVSQWERAGDVLSSLDGEIGVVGLDPVSQRELARWLASAQTDRSLEWMDATRLSDGQRAKLPADLCLRRDPARRAFEPPFLLGSGTAAGATLEAATLHAVLELIERDALALWWRGGRRGLAVDPELSEFGLTLGALRRGRTERRTWLLDLTTDLGPPCLVAVSCASGGADFAFGAAARGALAEAARAALLEVCQMELAYELVRRKIRERGESALNPADRRHLARAAAINAETCELLRPIPERRDHAAPPRTLADTVARASRLGVEFYRVDLTRPPDAIPAVRVLAPALQPEPSQLVSERLRAVITATGGGDAHTGGAPLL